MISAASLTILIFASFTWFLLNIIVKQEIKDKYKKWFVVALFALFFIILMIRNNELTTFFANVGAGFFIAEIVLEKLKERANKKKNKTNNKPSENNQTNNKE